MQLRISNALRNAVVAGGLLIGLSACAANQQLYAWNGYEGELLAYTKNPQDVETFETALAEDIAKAEADGKKVPPGIYAEHGYVLLQMGQKDAAIMRFQQERDLWPESAYLMDNVIRRLNAM